MCKKQLISDLSALHTRSHAKVARGCPKQGGRGPRPFLENLQTKAFFWIASLPAVSKYMASLLWHHAPCINSICIFASCLDSWNQLCGNMHGISSLTPIMPSLQRHCLCPTLLCGTMNVITAVKPRKATLLLYIWPKLTLYNLIIHGITFVTLCRASKCGTIYCITSVAL